MDEILLSKIRLAVVAELLNNEWVAFSALAQAADATPGNLGAHVSKLVDAGYVEEEKAFVGRRPQTRYKLTERGRDAFVSHVREMQSLLDPQRTSV
jgi:DNA-binding MarR family transcriptional regulator